MIYRKVAKFVVAALVAAFLSVGSSGGVSAFAQQSYGSGVAPCAGCSQTISFPASNVSPMPLTASGMTYPVGQVVYSSPVTQSLPATSTFVDSTLSNVVFDGTVSNTVFANQVNESYGTYPTSTYASEQIVNEGTISEPVGTVTSMPAPSYAPPVTSYVQPQPSFAQPVTSYASPAPVYVQPVTVAQPVYYPAARSTPVRSTLLTGYQMVSNGVGTVTSGLAQMKAQQAANGGIRGHIGGGLGGARYEGVGWSNQSPQAAIQQCCYWGTRPTAQIGVSRGADGLWYACVLYN